MSTRTDIRNAIGNKLTVAAVCVTANLIRGRNNTISSTSFPACAVYAINEDIEVRSLAPNNRTQYRQLQVQVDYFTGEVAGSTTIIDDLFDIGSAAVEAAVLADVTLNGVCRDIHLAQVAYSIEPDEERRWGTARHTFNCIYLTTD